VVPFEHYQSAIPDLGQDQCRIRIATCSNRSYYGLNFRDGRLNAADVPIEGISAYAAGAVYNAQVGAGKQK
jgi:hypothetical protein